jgi:regulator of protease activity HflC (stomatin/prohibitin superfamily)
VIQEGAGISFFYWQPINSIALVPANTRDANFVFNETTGNFQSITVQGQLTYRISDPKKAAELLNFTVRQAALRQGMSHVSDDPEKLPQRIINAVQVHTRNELLRLPLEEALKQAEGLAKTVLGKIRESKILAEMGVECLSVIFTSVRPIPEMAKALEAEYREALQKRADEAIYARRAAAVEKERKIKENELDTEVALEQQKKELVELQGTNIRKQAEDEAHATQVKFAAYQKVDPKVLLALGFMSMGNNAEKIGNLTITPDLLSMLMGTSKS